MSKQEFTGPSGRFLTFRMLKRNIKESDDYNGGDDDAHVDDVKVLFLPDFCMSKHDDDDDDDDGLHIDHVHGDGGEMDVITPHPNPPHPTQPPASPKPGKPQTRQNPMVIKARVSLKAKPLNPRAQNPVTRSTTNPETVNP